MPRIQNGDIVTISQKGIDGERINVCKGIGGERINVYKWIGGERYQCI